MAPDLNSLPPSRSPSVRPSNSQQHSTTAASGSPDNLRPQHGQTSNSPPVGSSARHRGSPRMERRRSSMLATWALNDSTGIPSSPGGGAGATMSGDPFHHHRAPSLGELHQELENEQEAQVNRLLAMIREQQGIITQYQNLIPTSTAVSEDANTPSSTHNVSAGLSLHVAGGQSTTQHHPINTANISSTAQYPVTSSRRASIARSGTPSRTSSPSINHNPRPMQFSSTAPTALYTPQSESGVEWPAPGPVHEERDEVSLIQQETSMLQRENLMLKARIEELEGRLAEIGRPSIRSSGEAEGTGDGGADGTISNVGGVTDSGGDITGVAGNESVTVDSEHSKPSSSAP